MAERDFEVKAIGVDYVCDACGTGTMQQNGKMITEGILANDLGPKWPHKCTACGHTANLDASYPFIKHVRV